MDTTSSEDITSSEGCATDSSSEDESELLEAAKINGITFQLPQGLCENREVFKEFLSHQHVSQIFDKNKTHLSQFLPKFPEKDQYEKEKTLKMLFGGKNFKFGNPVKNFHENLRAGNYRPDIQKMRNLMTLLKKKDQRFQEKKIFENLLTDMVVSRQKLLDISYNLPPGFEARTTYSESKPNPLYERTKRRYFHEISTINKLVGEISDFSEDENFPEGAPTPKKAKISLKSRNNSDRIFSTFQNPDYFDPFDPQNAITDQNFQKVLREHKIRKFGAKSCPEFDTKGITLKDIALRTQIILKKSDRLPKVEHRPQKSEKSRKKYIEKPEFKPEIKKSLSDNSDFSDTDSFIEVQSPVPKNLPSSNKSSGTPNKLIQKNTVCLALSQNREKVTTDNPSLDNNSNNKLLPVKSTAIIKDMGLPGISGIPGVGVGGIVKFPEIKEEIVEETPPTISIPQDSGIQGFNGKLIPATLSDLEGIDMMNLPVDLDESNIDILDDIHIKPELMQDTHPSFFSLIRDIICSTMDHRMSLANLEERLKAWQENPISPLNDWYSLVENWTVLLPSAISFLCGDSSEQPEDFVPYIEYKPLLQVYQWIGAGRDSDNLIMPLSQFWLDHRDETVIQTPIEAEVDILDKEKPSTPPPPRFPTTWSVRKASQDEIAEFRRQEKERYSNPHKAYTYKMNGYESSVGPVKGIYGQSHSGGQKARGHSMLNADRPNYVTILTLVRDATARLPNGEGTRSDICELLKSSQYISNSAPENVLQSVVSGALDRMHTEYDPCVKYDTKKKIWIYLHRNRTEADFERIHQQCQGMSKHHKKNSRKKNSTPKNTPPKSNPPKKTDPPPENPKKTFKTPVSRVFTVPTVQTIQTTPPILSALQKTPLEKITPKPSLADSPKIENTSNDIENVIPLTRVETQPKILLPPSENSGTSQGIVGNPLNTPGSLSTIGSQKSLIKIINNNQKTPQTQTVFIKQIDPKKQPILTQNLVQLGTQNRGKATQIGTQNLVLQKNQPILVQSENTKKMEPVQNVVLQNLAQMNQNSNQVVKNSAQSNPNIVQISQNQISQNLTQLNQNLSTNESNQILKQTTVLTPGQQNKILETLKQKVALSTAVSQASQIGQNTQNLQIGQNITCQGQVINQNLTHQTISQSNQNNQTAVLAVQQAILKQQGVQKVQIQAAKGQSLLGQQRIITQVASPKTITTQATQNTPLVAKVLTNSAGQVISVESLLAHQKQHGTLPQGTTLRVSGKPGQPNLIQIASNSGTAVAQFAVVSQGNQLKTIATQNQKILTTVAPSQSGQNPLTNIGTKAQMCPKTKVITSKIGGGFVNAKIIQKGSQMGQKGLPQVINTVTKVSPKAVSVAKSLISTTQGPGTVRMVNATGLNLAHIGGKPVLFASKGGLAQNLTQNVLISTQSSQNSSGANQNVIIQDTGSCQGASHIRIADSAPKITTTNFAANSAKNFVAVSSVANQSAPIVLSQLKVQNTSSLNSISPLVVKTTGVAQNVAQNTVVLSGIKVNSQNSQNQRVVLASQGQGGQLVAQQILIPPNFQGGAINIKTLQGLKVIPLAQTQQVKGRPQQVFARIMGPTTATRVAQVPNIQSTSTQLSDNNPTQQNNE